MKLRRLLRSGGGLRLGFGILRGGSGGSNLLKTFQIGLTPLRRARQVRIESAAPARLADHAYFAALRLDQALRESQPQAGALDFL